ncbi:MAG: hypothetical protein KAI29_11565 [Cyclobacteriaceae bacterium]|nr:hypothetical protein [Cyclobacteriaceae bacterium]
MSFKFKRVNTLVKLSWILVYFIFFIIITTNCTNSKKLDALDTNWKFQSQREEIAPAYWVTGDVRFDDEPTLALSGDGKA